MDTKQCSRCQETKPTSAFYSNKRWRDGFHPYCRACLLVYQKTQREAKLAISPGRFRWKRDLIRHDYFKEIDASIKAYVLGMLAADGNVLPSHHRITIELSAKDQELLRLIRDELVPGGAITTRCRQGREYQALAFVSRSMIADLETFGVTAAKSCTLAWPDKLPECYARPFILGLFDGDGFITSYRRGNTLEPYVGFTGGSPQLLRKIVAVIEQQTGVHVAGPWSKGSSRAYTIRVGGRKAYIVDQWLHADGLGLARKRLAPIDGQQPAQSQESA